MELFFGGIIEPNTDKNFKIGPWNHFKLIFFTQDLCNLEKNTHFFLAFQELAIETELYL